MDDKELIALLFARSERAVAALETCYGGLVRRVSRNILPDEEDARECVNDVYLALCEAPALPEDAMELPAGVSNIYDDLEVCHLFVEIGNGMTVHLRCFAGGYVMYAGLRGVCVQIPQDVFDAVCGAF